MKVELGRPIDWKPASIAQSALLDTIGYVDFVLYGGAAGGGKSEALLIDASQEYLNPNLHALIVRKTFKEIELDLEPKGHRLYSQMGATYNQSKKRWEWPHGAAIQFGYLEQPKDVYRYYGSEFSYIGVDESTHHQEETIRHLVTMRLRSRDPDLKLRVRLGTNPGNIGGVWHKAIFMGPHCTHCIITPESKKPWEVYRDAVWPSDGIPITGSDGKPMSTCFIPAKVTDHNLLEGYENRLSGLPEQLRRALLEGCWESTEGQFYDCWDPKIHVVKWETEGDVIGLRHFMRTYFSWWVSVDWGFGKSSAVAYLNVKTPEGMIYTVDEILVKHMDAPDFAQYLKTRWHGLVDENKFEREILAWYLSPDAWQSRGMRSDSGNSVAEQMAQAADLPFESASNDRKGGAMAMYSLLKAGKWKICGDRCPNLIKAIPSRVHDPDNPGDLLKVIGDPLDDCIDSARYSIFSFIQVPKKPRNLLIQEFCTSDDPTAYAMQRIMAEKKFAKKSQFISYRTGKVGRA